MSSAKKNKKLKNFFSSKATVSKRFKSLTSYLEGATEEECISVIKEHEDIAFSAISERFAECENAIKKGKHHTADLLSVLSTLKRFVDYTQPQPGNKKVPYIERILEKCLSPQNKHVVRELGFASLLLLIGSQTEPTAAQLTLFRAAILLEPLGGAAPPKSGTAEDLVLCPSLSAPTKEEAVALWVQLLDFVTAHKKAFCTWYRLVQREYLSLFYPDICVQLGICKSARPGSFKTCPMEIQRATIDRLELWIDRPAISKEVWKEDRAPLLIEILRQAMQLPLTCADTISQTMNVYRAWLLNPATSLELVGEDRIQSLWRSYLSCISLIILTNSKPGEELQAHVTLVNDVLSMYLLFANDLGDEIDDETWMLLQRKLLDTIHELLSRSSPFDLNQLATTLTDALFHSLFIVWIQSPVTTDEMWQELREKVCTLVEWKSLLVQWKDIMLQISQILVELIYTSGVRKKTADGESLADDTMLETEVALIHPSLATIPWTESRLHSIWFIFLNVLGNPNSITVPDNYTVAMSCVGDLIELFQRAEYRLAVGTPPPIPLLDVFLPWLFEAVNVDERRNRGRLLGYAILCRLFIRPSSRQVPIEYLAHFFRALKSGLGFGHSSCVWVILRHAANLFSSCLPGNEVLIHDFLREIDNLFTSKTAPPADIQLKALQVISSLITYPQHMKPQDLPTDNPEKPMDAEQLRTQLSTVLLKAASYPGLANPLVKEAIVWNLVFLVQVELASPSCRKEVLVSCVQLLLESCSEENNLITCAALDALASLALVQEELVKEDAGVVKFLLATLSNNIVQLVQKGREIKDIRSDTITAHYQCILQWLVVGRVDLTNATNSPLVSKIFRAVEFGLLGEEVVPRSTMMVSTAGGSVRAASSKKVAVRPHASMTRTAMKGKEYVNQHARSLFSQLYKMPSHGSDDVQEAAYIFLCAMSQHYHNFPSTAGCSQVATWTSPKDVDNTDDRTKFFIYHGSIIFSLSTADSADTLRFTCRDCTGKYTWEVKPLWLDETDRKALSEAVPSEVFSTVPASSNVVARNSSISAQINYDEQVSLGVVPSHEKIRSFGENPDMGHAVLNFLQEKHPQILPSERIFFDRPFQPNPSYASAIDETLKLLQNQNERETAYAAARPPISVFAMAGMPKQPTPKSEFHVARLFLSHFGLLSEDARQSLFCLDNNARFRRSLKELDKVNGRETIKVGLVYVKPGQEDQRSILANEERSPKYAAFVKGLGWDVDLGTHPGFMGGLDRKKTTGASAPYYSTAMVEVIFHDITRMPTSDSDPQQIHKKRHVGNDIVHIVWNEHGRPYRPSTISSQFNNVHIIIDPLPTELYEVRIVAKESVPTFGPLQNGMVVSMDLLPQLVRQTAIAANRAVRSTSDVYKPPYSVRAAQIKEINSRYKNHKFFEEFVGELFRPLKPSAIVEATAAASYGNTPRDGDAQQQQSSSSSSSAKVGAATADQSSSAEDLPNAAAPPAQ
mmetsp:Transcript_16622/g.49721  ORF Transcript_16622/g.49721 Transcript_16622/m.49721 type:complete len:1477 (-) Transcript_16622:147-4577(-)